MNAPRISIGIPFFNNADTLPDAVRSVFSQTFTDWELFLSDDGSTDGSLDFAKQISDPRVTVLSDGVNRGLVYRLNQMSNLSRGEYIARMDGDDLMHPERLARQVAFLDAHPEVDVVGSAVYSLNSRGDVAGSRNHGDVGRTPEAILSGKGFAHPSVTGRAGWFRCNLYDPRFVRCQDMELWCRTCETSCFAQLPEPLLFYREGRVSLANYLHSGRDCREIYRIYGASRTGRFGAAHYLLLSHVKSLAYRLFALFGAQETLVSRRYRSLEAVSAKKARVILEKVRRTSIPGIDVPPESNDRIAFSSTTGIGSIPY